ncbi:MAG: hypothetical protein WEC35_00395 [Nitrosopumilaceae archaeon]
MTEKLDPIRILDGIITDLKYRAQNQDEMGNKIVLSKLVDKMIQVKKQYLFEMAEQEYANTASK